MKLGISSYSLTWSIGVPGYEPPANPLSAVDLLDISHKQSISVVQIADNLPLHSLTLNDIINIKETSKKHNITIEVGTKGTSPDHLLKYLNIAKDLKSSIVRTLITTPDIIEAERDMKQVLPQFIEAGIQIAVENHGLHTTKQLVSLLNNIDSPYVGVCLDTVNSFGALECPKQVIDDLVPYIINLHIKDFDIKRVKHMMGYEILGAPAGSGKLDVDVLIKSILKQSREPNAILELWTPFTNTVEETIKLENQWFYQSLDFLKTKFSL